MKHLVNEYSRRLLVCRFKAEGLRPFNGKEGVFHGRDHEAILNLPDDEFRERYLGEMTVYFYEHAEAQLEKSREDPDHKLEPISCGGCHLPIDSPKNFRRYYGNTLDHDCFVKRLNEDRKTERETRDPLLRKYWDRIASLEHVENSAR